MIDLESFVGDRFYLDTNILIHFVEGHATLAPVVLALFRSVRDNSISAVTSELSLSEVLVKLIATSKIGVVAAYEALMAPGSKVETRPVTRSILRASAELRANLAIRAFDAIHVATAVETECAFFLTEDLRIKVPTTMTLLHLNDLTSTPAP
jgi:predicted nucleic acid-binding protein